MSGSRSSLSGVSSMEDWAAWYGSVWAEVVDALWAQGVYGMEGGFLGGFVAAPVGLGVALVGLLAGWGLLRGFLR